MRKLLILVLALTFVGSGNAYAHQPVALLNTDTTASKGPLLVDGTISFAVRGIVGSYLTFIANLLLSSFIYP